MKKKILIIASAIFIMTAFLIGTSSTAIADEPEGLDPGDKKIAIEDCYNQPPPYYHMTCDGNGGQCWYQLLCP